LPFRSTGNNELLLGNPWFISSALHGVLLAGALLVLVLSRQNVSRDVVIDVIESPQTAPLPVRMTEPRPLPKPQTVREVFGISPKAASIDQGLEVKAGNTVAKAPDDEKLRPGDLDSLPVPSDEYLVTLMPQLKTEVRVAYPPESRKKGVQGAVVMDLLIDTTGKVREATLVEGPNQELSQAALVAAKGFQFSPAAIKDKPVAVRIRYTYRFVLER